MVLVLVGIGIGIGIGLSTGILISIGIDIGTHIPLLPLFSQGHFAIQTTYKKLSFSSSVFLHHLRRNFLPRTEMVNIAAHFLTTKLLFRHDMDLPQSLAKRFSGVRKPNPVSGCQNYALSFLSKKSIFGPRY